MLSNCEFIRVVQGTLDLPKVRHKNLYLNVQVSSKRLNYLNTILPQEMTIKVPIK
jgi:hypothetical protein